MVNLDFSAQEHAVWVSIEQKKVYMQWFKETRAKLNKTKIIQHKVFLLTVDSNWRLNGVAGALAGKTTVQTVNKMKPLNYLANSRILSSWL